MKIKKCIRIIICTILIAVLVSCTIMKLNEKKEYLHITTITYGNEEDSDDEKTMVTYVYDINSGVLQAFDGIPLERTVYPLSYYDYKNEKIYHTDAGKGETFDNLYVYDVKTKTDTRLTDGKFLFNEFIMTGEDSNKLICNVAPQFVTVTQPAIYDIRNNTFDYLNKDDEDTWCFSLSYNSATDKMVSLTCSDTEMRSWEVTAVTYIRPKTIYMMNPDFSDYEPIYYTKDFEIRSVRQLDDERILIMADPVMGGGYSDRFIMVHNIVTEESYELDMSELRAIDSIYARDNAEGFFLLAKDRDRKISIFYYDLQNQTLTDIFENGGLSSDTANIVNFSYSCY